MARPTKFDYDSDVFYDEIFALAFQGLLDAEIADGLMDKFGQTLTPEVFSKMKHGCYEGWNKEQNERRGARLSQTLERARRKINSIVRGRYLKAALGGIEIKGQAKTSRRMKVNGVFSDDEDIQTTETTTHTAPNMQALATWLYNYDPDWKRRMQEKKLEDSGRPTDIGHGVPIDKWIKEQVTDEKE